MKTTVLAIALALATMPLTFAQTAAPAKTDTSKSSKPKKNKPAKKDTSKPAASTTAAPTATPVKK